MNDSLGRPLVLLSCSFFFLVLFLGFAHPHSGHGLFSILSLQKPVGFHYIVPTTASNAEACKLIFSGAVLGYPEPILVGWEGRGRWNGSESQLFRLSESLDYLTSLRKEQDEDIVLILEASNVWLQLPPEILIQRYFRAIDKSNRRLESDGILDMTSAEGARIKNTILFGADKFCWPQNGDTVQCWSAPQSPLPDTIFGPDTDQNDVSLRPRYLNSGTIMGPVKDVRDLLRAALDRVDEEWDDEFSHNDSDQHYVHILWGEQEEARIGIQNGTWIIGENDARTDFHMAVDHESDAFQGNNWYSQYVTWMSFNHSSVDGIHIQPRTNHNPGRLDRMSLTPDLLSIPGPYSAGDKKNDALPVQRGWQDVMLGTNTATGQVFPLYHVTGNKMAVSQWWPRMWFHPYGADLQRAARRRWLSSVNVQRQHVIAKVRGIEYVAVEPNHGDVFQGMRARDKSNQKGGVWNDLGEYMRWNEVCEDHEDIVFNLL